MNEIDEEQETTERSGERHALTTPKRRRLSNKARIVLATTAAVVVVAGAGFWIWHEQPGFCNALCHSPMDSYVEGYQAANTLMAERHLEADVACLQCHEPRIDEQVSEAVAWAAGDFDDPMGASNLANTQGFCLRSGCHTEGAWHDRHDALDLQKADGCADCHQMHLNHTTWSER